MGAGRVQSGKAWPGTRADLAAYTDELLQFLAAHEISMVGLLAWESNALDMGVKDTGIDDGVKHYLANGPDQKDGVQKPTR